MDKTTLIKLIEQLKLERSLEGFLVGQIEKREVTPELLDNVANLLEVKAEQEEMMGDMLARLADRVGELEQKGKEIEASHKEEADKLFEQFLDKVEGAVKEAKGGKAEETTEDQKEQAPQAARPPKVADENFEKAGEI